MRHPPLLHGGKTVKYSPWFPAGTYPPAPSSCKIDQAHVLHRHASRYPTAGAANIIKSTLEHLKDGILHCGPSSSLFWLADYNYTLGTDDLVPFGFDEATYNRYKFLAHKNGIFVRSSSCDRVVQTAQLWSKAFQGASKNRIKVSSPLVISDARTSNDTLANNDCPLHRARHVHWQWAHIFTSPIARRLQKDVSNYTVSATDVIVLMSLCPFESVANRQTSRFCFLFTEEEFHQYEYYNDLEKYYNTGYGNPLGPVQGTGYVTELLARLTDRQVEDATQTNSTLDRDERTFPLGKGLYVDFSHDNTMAAIVSAMGLFRTSESQMPFNHVNKERNWVFGHIAPFAGRMVFERLQCTDGVRYVRILANEAVQRLEECHPDENGLCRLDDFVKSQVFARVEGQKKWAECFDYVGGMD